MPDLDEDVFPLDIAAKRIFRLVGQEFSVRDLLEAAMRGEVGVGIRIDGEIGWLSRNDLEEFFQIASRPECEFDQPLLISNVRLNVDEAKKFNSPGSPGCYLDDPLNGVMLLHNCVALKDLVVSDGEAICLSNSILCLHKKEDQTASLRNEPLYRGVFPVETMNNLTSIDNVKSSERLWAYVDAYLDMSSVYFVKCEKNQNSAPSRSECAKKVLDDYKSSDRINELLRTQSSHKDLAKQAVAIAKVNGNYGWPPKHRPKN